MENYSFTGRYSGQKSLELFPKADEGIPVLGESGVIRDTRDIPKLILQP